MSISLSSVRRLTVLALGASAVAGGMLFGALPAANAAAPAVYAPTAVGLHQVQPAFFGHHHHDLHHHTHRHGGLHIGGLFG